MDKVGALVHRTNYIAAPSTVVAAAAAPLVALAQRLTGIRWRVTSHKREDNTDHADGSCLDIAPVGADRCYNFTQDPAFYRLAASIAEEPGFKGAIAYIAIEPDHLHVRFGSSPDTTIIKFDHPVQGCQMTRSPHTFPLLGRRNGGITPTFDARSIGLARGGCETDLVARIASGDREICDKVRSVIGDAAYRNLVTALASPAPSATQIASAKQAINAVTMFAGTADAGALPYWYLSGASAEKLPIPNNYVVVPQVGRAMLLEAAAKTPVETLVNIQTVPALGVISYTVTSLLPQMVPAIWMNLGLPQIQAPANARFRITMTGRDVYNQPILLGPADLVFDSNVTRADVLITPYKVVQGAVWPCMAFICPPSSTSVADPNLLDSVAGQVTYSAASLAVTVTAPENTQITTVPVAITHPMFQEILSLYGPCC